jgi:sulfur-carrier protein
MKILYFAWLRTKLGAAEEQIDLTDDITHLEDLLLLLKSRNDAYRSAFADMDVIRVAFDQEYVIGNPPLDGVTEVAFFPPVTGG